MKKIFIYQNTLYLCIAFERKSIGEMAEWSIAAVLKTVEVRASGGSNPSLSAERLSQEQPKSRQVLQINDLWDFFRLRVSGCKAIKKPILDIVA